MNSTIEHNNADRLAKTYIQLLCADNPSSLENLSIAIVVLVRMAWKYKRNPYCHYDWMMMMMMFILK